MKRLKQHWSARPLSWLLSVALVWPALIFLMAGGDAPVKAQGLTRNAQPLWAVLDFENHTGFGGPEVGREASDAFVVELGKSNKYDVLSRQETQQGLANSGLTQPLDVIGLQKLGRNVQSDAVATGEVAAVSFSKSPRQATVSVIVRVTDSNTGELVNGALAQGTSNPRAVDTNDDDALVTEAISNAAFAAVRQIVQFNLPKATVLNNEDQDRVLLNKGTRDGLYDGLNMVVTRRGNEVGRIRVGDASADQSDAVVTQRGLGIQPQDSATAIYQLPAYVVKNGSLTANPSDVSSDGANSNGGHRSIFSGVTGILLAVIAGALLVSFIRRGASSGSLGGAEIGKPLAIANRTDVIGGVGTYPGGPPDGIPIETGTTTTTTTVTFGATEPQPPNFVPVAVRITATPGNIGTRNFVEYHVYRSDFPPDLQYPITTTGTTTTAGTGSGFSFGQVPLLSAAIQGDLLIYDDGADKINFVSSKPQPTIGGSSTTSGTSGTSGSGTTGGVQQVTESLGTPNGTGLQYGKRVQYFIEALYLQPGTTAGSGLNPGQPGNTTGTTTSGTSGSTGSTTGSSTGSTSTTSGVSTTSGFGTTYQLTGRTPTNFITYLEPPLLTQGNTTTGSGGALASSTSSTNVIVNIPATLGANDYILQLSADPGFSSSVTLTPNSSGPYTAPTTNPRDGTGTPVFWYLQTGGVNKTLVQLFPTATEIFLRVGARDSTDGTSTSTNPYVYSDPITVPTDFLPTSSTITPPAAPGVKKHH